MCVVKPFNSKRFQKLSVHADICTTGAEELTVGTEELAAGIDDVALYELHG